MWKEEGKVTCWSIRNILERKGGRYFSTSCNSKQLKRSVNKLQNWVKWQCQKSNQYIYTPSPSELWHWAS